MNRGFSLGNRFAPYVLRFALAALFLWFGGSQVLNPTAWTSWLPAWSATLSLTPVQLVLINGWFEIIFGAALVVGFMVQWAALLLAVHTLIIAYEVGYNDVGVRDFVLGLCTLSLALFRWDAHGEVATGSTHAPVKPPLF